MDDLFGMSEENSLAISVTTDEASGSGGEISEINLAAKGKELAGLKYGKPEGKYVGGQIGEHSGSKVVSLNAVGRVQPTGTQLLESAEANPRTQLQGNTCNPDPDWRPMQQHGTTSWWQHYCCLPARLRHSTRSVGARSQQQRQGGSAAPGAAPSDLGPPHCAPAAQTVGDGPRARAKPTAWGPMGALAGGQGASAKAGREQRGELGAGGWQARGKSYGEMAPVGTDSSREGWRRRRRRRGLPLARKTWLQRLAEFKDKQCARLHAGPRRPQTQTGASAAGARRHSLGGK